MNKDVVIAAMRGRNPENPSDRTKGIKLEQTLEVNESNISNTLTTVQKDNLVVEKPICLNTKGRKGDENLQPSVQDRVYSTDGTSTAITTSFMPSILEKSKERFFEQAESVLENNDCKPGDTIDAFNQKVNKTGISPTLTTRPEGFKTAILPVIETVGQTLCSGGHGYSMGNILETKSRYRIRKLTPRECGRLMGVLDSDIDRMEKVNSNSQLYKQFGNSIVVPVLEALFRQLNIKNVKSWNEIKQEGKTDISIKRIGNIYGENKGTGFAGNVWDSNKISPTLTTMTGGGERTNDC